MKGGTIIEIVDDSSRSCSSSTDRNKKTISINQFSSKENELLKFSSIIKIIRLLINHIQQPNKITTIRDIYYQDVNLFEHKQINCKNLLTLIIEESLQWSLENDIGIYPSPKGLVYGDWFFQTKNQPTLIPINFQKVLITANDKDSDRKLLIVVLEKDAVFQSFVNFLGKSNSTILSNFLIITGKGYPDKLTQKFLFWLKQSFKNTVSVGFFDSDVYGINIYKQYLKYDNSLIYGGVYLIETDLVNWLQINLREITLIINMLKKNSDGDKSSEMWRRELTRGLLLFNKSEMNVIELSNNNSINDYLIGKIQSIE
ncbi:SPO11 [[Candida] subhashii]|uniref:DNA topoisomerase (ATP-hydrolyzing) n=1 Tax=[Candida] subhashii TaxID=561895 RepID=A0A8J5QHI9_9ASCO|nr:SPO11 [[Candida] subhashii]KAG7663162.1 SPO11 [[Candida] subhashii]